MTEQDITTAAAKHANEHGGGEYGLAFKSFLAGMKFVFDQFTGPKLPTTQPHPGFFNNAMSEDARHEAKEIEFESRNLSQSGDQC